MRVEARMRRIQGSLCRKPASRFACMASVLGRYSPGSMVRILTGRSLEMENKGGERLI